MKMEGVVNGVNVVNVVGLERTVLYIRMDLEIKKKLKHLAIEKNMTLNEYINTLLYVHVRSEDRK